MGYRAGAAVITLQRHFSPWPELPPEGAEGQVERTAGLGGRGGASAKCPLVGPSWTSRASRLWPCKLSPALATRQSPSRRHRDRVSRTPHHTQNLRKALEGAGEQRGA